VAAASAYLRPVDRRVDVDSLERSVDADPVERIVDASPWSSDEDTTIFLSPNLGYPLWVSRVVNRRHRISSLVTSTAYCLSPVYGHLPIMFIIIWVGFFRCQFVGKTHHSCKKTRLSCNTLTFMRQGCCSDGSVCVRTTSRSPSWCGFSWAQCCCVPMILGKYHNAPEFLPNDVFGVT